MKWFTVDDIGIKNLPEWTRSFGISDENVVFVPAAIAEVSEDEIHKCTLYDGTPSTTYKKHRYVPVKWLTKEFPKNSELCEMIEARAQETISF